MPTLKSTQDLILAGLIDAQDETVISRTEEDFSISISEAMQTVIQNANDPIGRQFIPKAEELERHPHEHADPIGDLVHSPVKGVVHRYPDRCLLKPIKVCAVYCRFCFRKEKVGPGNAALTPDELEQAYQYIESHPEIWEVILTGGDPLFMKPKSLGTILRRLVQIPHVEVLRVHTRIPLVDPDRINDDLLAALQSEKALYVALHANHPNEFTPAGVAACRRLVDAGIPLISQTVLLKGVNDSEAVLGELMRTFVKNRIKPYYLHHLDAAPGTRHFHVPLEVGQQLMHQLRGRYSGLCQPTYVVDIPGGFGKSPVSPRYLSEDHILDYQGQTHRRPD